jgi:hypothetical protein
MGFEEVACSWTFNRPVQTVVGKVPGSVASVE